MIRHNVNSIIEINNGKGVSAIETQLAIAELAETEAQHHTELLLAVAELAEATMGGAK